MKRLTALLIGTSLLLQPGVSLALTSTPISQHYVQPVIDRANIGLGNASGGTPASEFELLFFRAIWQMSAAIMELIDTENRLVEQERNLIKITPCLHIDLLIIEEKIEEVREALRQAFRDKRVTDQFMLEELLRYLNDRYANLIDGAVDQHYEDERFYWLYNFDNEGWCCQPPEDTFACQKMDRETCRVNNGISYKNADDCSDFCQPPASPPADPRACPFHSDYLPASPNGYGCDLDALDSIGSGGHPPVQAERDAMAEFISQRDAFINDMSFLLTLTNDVRISMGLPPIPPSEINFRPDITIPHRTRVGCSPTDGTTAVPIGEFDDPPLWPEGAVRIELRGPFFITKDETSLIRVMIEVLRRWGRDREQADYLKFVSEYPPGADRAAATTREEDLDPIEKLTRRWLRAYYQRINMEIADLETKPVVQSADSLAQIAELLKPLREVNKEFAELSSQKDRGMRKFTSMFAAFLRRSCMYRPCNKMLDRVLKIVLEDSCFPYTDGSYVGSQNQHEICRDNAEVDEEL